MSETQLINAIKAHIAKGDKAKDMAEQHYIAAGLHLTTLKTLHDGGGGTWAEWEQLLKTKIGIGKSRASELMQIANGRKTAQQVKDDTAKRQKKMLEDLRYNGGDGKDDSPEASADATTLDDEPAVDDQTKEPPRAEVAKLIRAWVQASAGVKRQFVRERWDEIVRVRKQLDANGGAAHEDRWIEGDTL